MRKRIQDCHNRTLWIWTLRWDKEGAYSWKYCPELHECAQQLGCEKYYLMDHSIAGLYSLSWGNRYLEEVKKFMIIEPPSRKWRTKAHSSQHDSNKQAAVNLFGQVHANHGLQDDARMGADPQGYHRNRRCLERTEDTPAFWASGWDGWEGDWMLYSYSW